MSEKLKPCPFCGELPQAAGGTAMHACRVLDREMRVPVAAWNRRADIGACEEFMPRASALAERERGE